jgi:hypothetical protein
MAKKTETTPQQPIAGQLINVSIDFAELLAKAKAAHSAFTRGKKNGKPYLALTIWVNDDVDQFGNDVAVQLNSSKEKKSAEGIIYVGHGRTANAKLKLDKTNAAPAVEYKDDLPF